MKNLALFIVSLLLCFAAAEGFFRWKERAADKQWYVYLPNHVYTFQPDSNILHGVWGKKKFTINKAGYRAVKDFEAHTKNWLCAGGSTTECNYLDDAETWYALLEQKAGKDFRFASIGRSGHTSKDHYYFLKKVLAEDKKINGVLLMCGINDLTKVLANPDFDLSVQEKDSLLHFQRAGRINQSGFFAHSALVYRIQQALRASQITTENSLDRKGEILLQWRTHYKSRTATLDTLPPLSHAVAIYEKNLRAIIALCKENGVPIIVINQAALWRKNLSHYEQSQLWMGGIGDFQNQKGCTYYAPQSLDSGLMLFNASTQRVCAESNVPMVDLYRALPKDTSVFYDDCHFNMQGARMAAEVIFPVLKGEL